MTSSSIISAHLSSFYSDETYGSLNAKVWAKYGEEKLDLGTISRSEAINAVVQNYWELVWGSKIKSQNIANLIIEWCFVAGNTETAVSYLQKKLGTTASGTMDAATLNALNKKDPSAFFKTFAADRKSWYEAAVKKNTALQSNLSMWLRRLNAIQWGVLTYANGTNFAFGDAVTTTQINDSKTNRSAFYTEATKYLARKEAATKKQEAASKQQQAAAASSAAFLASMKSLNDLIKRLFGRVY